MILLVWIERKKETVSAHLNLPLSITAFLHTIGMPFDDDLREKKDRLRVYGNRKPAPKTTNVRTRHHLVEGFHVGNWHIVRNNKLGSCYYYY